MATVIDIISISETLRRNRPGLVAPFEGDGIQLILEPTESAHLDAADVRGRVARITRPDGSSIERAVAGAETRHGVLALFFAKLSRDDVPRLSTVTW